MKHIFVPLDIRNELSSRYIDIDALHEFDNLNILPTNELVKKDMFDFLNNFPAVRSGASGKATHMYLISPFKVNISDLELLENLNKRFQAVFGDEIVIHITMSEHTAVLLNREFWHHFVNNFNMVINDVWEPKFLHINEKLSMSNVFDHIKNAVDEVPPFYLSFIKPNADKNMNNWLEGNGIIKSKFYNFDFFLFDTFYQSSVVSEQSRFETNGVRDIDEYLNIVKNSKKIKDLVCLNRTYKYHRPKLINDLYKLDLLSKSYFSLSEVCDESEEILVVRDLGLPIIAKGEPPSNVVNGRMLHDSVGNIDWVKNSKLFVSTESLMYDTESYIPNFTPYNIKFISEKVHKPLAWGMPFIVFGCAGSLEHVKALGFKTYEPFIDESYDLVEDPEERYQLGLSAIQEFINSPYPREEVNVISEHNVKHFHSNELYSNLVDNLVDNILDDYVESRKRDDFNFRNQ